MPPGPDYLSRGKQQRKDLELQDPLLEDGFREVELVVPEAHKVDGDPVEALHHGLPCRGRDRRVDRWPLKDARAMHKVEGGRGGGLKGGMPHRSRGWSTGSGTGSRRCGP